MGIHHLGLGLVGARELEVVEVEDGVNVRLLRRLLKLLVEMPLHAPRLLYRNPGKPTTMVSKPLLRRTFGDPRAAVAGACKSFDFLVAFL